MIAEANKLLEALKQNNRAVVIKRNGEILPLKFKGTFPSGADLRKAVGGMPSLNDFANLGDEWCLVVNDEAMNMAMFPNNFIEEIYCGLILGDVVVIHKDLIK
jgi:hypothetical protein